MKLWPFGPRAAPEAVAAPEPHLRKTPIPPGYEEEHFAIVAEARAMFRRVGGPAGAADALAREIVALQARLDKHGIGK